MSQTSINKILKNNWKVISNKYLSKTILWISLTTVLIVFSVLIKVHPNWYNQLLKWDFFNNGMNFKDPNITKDMIILFETYLYMAILSSIIASVTLILIEIKIIKKKYIEMKYQIISNIDNNYFIFKNLLVVNISQNITYIFCFTNAITFVLVLVFFAIYFIIDNILDTSFKYGKGEIRRKWWDNNQQKSTITILTIEVGYFLLKNVLKSSSINIDFDQILKYFIPASSLALIIAVFIQSLLKNNVKKILNNMNNAPTKANDFKIFYKLEQENAITNYDFIKEAPIVVKNKINETNVSTKDVIKLIDQIYQLIDTLQEKKKSKNTKENEINYLIYHIFYEIKTEAEIEQISKKIKPKGKRV